MKVSKFGDWYLYWSGGDFHQIRLTVDVGLEDEERVIKTLMKMENLPELIPDADFPESKQLRLTELRDGLVRGIILPAICEEAQRGIDENIKKQLDILRGLRNDT